MKKTLISIENLDNYICTKDNNVYIDKNTIITAGAKDMCSTRGLNIIYTPSPSLSSANCNEQKSSSCCVNEDKALKNIIADHHQASTSGCCTKRSDPFEQVLIKLALMLQENFAINDMEELRKLSFQAAKIIKENLD